MKIKKASTVKNFAFFLKKAYFLDELNPIL